MSAPERLFASCAPGLEPLLADEVRQLGGLQVEVISGGVAFRGHRRVYHRAHRELGLASHLQFEIGRVEARHFSEFADRCAALPWARYLRADRPRRVRAFTRRCRLIHTGAIAERVEKAIARSLGVAPAAPNLDEPPTVFVRGQDDRFVVRVDTSGAPLHRRGYRGSTVEAPLREDLARAVIKASGWNPAAGLWDPCGGSGTLAIEAATLASRLAPGRLRVFALEHTPLFHEDTWNEGLQVAQEDGATLPLITLSDRDPKAVESARKNARMAGVESMLRFESAPLSEAKAPDETAWWLVTNPPYGDRLGEAETLGRLYQAIGARSRAAEGLAVVAADQRLARRTGVPLRVALITKSGGKTIHVLTGSDPHRR